MAFICEYCKKEYASSSSRCNHIKKFHSQPIVQNCIQPLHNSAQNCVEKSDKKTNKCPKCEKELSNRYSLWRHEQICKVKQITIDDEKFDLIVKENIEMKKENLEIKKELNDLKDLLIKSLKIHPKTFNKMNNQLINQNNNNNNNNNNTINNTINIYQLGNENLSEVLTDEQKMKILNRQGMSLNELVELLYSNPEYKQFKNVCITNLQSSFAQKYDEKTNSFIAVNKKEIINDMIDYRMTDITNFFDEFKDELPAKKAENLQRFIDRMCDECDEIKGLKKEEIQLILYNKKDN